MVYLKGEQEENRLLLKAYRRHRPSGSEKVREGQSRDIAIMTTPPAPRSIVTDIGASSFGEYAYGEGHDPAITQAWLWLHPEAMIYLLLAVVVPFSIAAADVCPMAPHFLTTWTSCVSG